MIGDGVLVDGGEGFWCSFVVAFRRENDGSGSLLLLATKWRGKWGRLELLLSVRERRGMIRVVFH